jgi:hypothetical protein
LTSFHRWNEWVLIALVATHIGAILYYKYAKRINLTSAMITGDKELVDTAMAPLVQDDSKVRLKAMAILIAIALVMYYFLR